MARTPRLALLSSLVLAAVVAVFGVVALWPSSADVGDAVEAVPFAAPGVTFPTAVVDDVQPVCPRAENGGVGSAGDDCGNVEATVSNGPGNGERVTVQVAPQVTDSGLVPGDEVRLQRTPAADGTETSYGSPSGHSAPGDDAGLRAARGRGRARWRGLFALVVLVFSGVLIWEFMLPALITGESGLLVGLAGSAMIMFVVLYLTHGVSIRTSAAWPARSRASWSPQGSAAWPWVRRG